MFCHRGRIRRGNRFSVAPPRRLGASSPLLAMASAGEGRFSDPPAGAKCGVLRLPYNPLALRGVLFQKVTFTKPRRRSRQRSTEWAPPWAVFLADPEKTKYVLHRKFKKHENTRGFALLKRVKPRTGRIETTFFASWSLPATHGHRFPRAVWLQDASPTRSLAPGDVLQQK